MTKQETDVLVIGGGPAGTTFATLLQSQGHHVTLLEKGHHPRFHIGESLLPMNLPILERLGVLDEVRAIGVPKLGADFTIGNSGEEERVFYFRDALGLSPGHAFEVRRSEFDQLLFENARRSGADIHEGMKVTKVTPTSEGTHEVEAADEQGGRHHWTANFLVDASGRDTFLSRANGWKLPNLRHASGAVFGHFRGVQRRTGDDQGNISIYWFKQGWIWMIPLRDGIMSIGAVCRPDFLRTRTASLDEFLHDVLVSIPEAAARIR